MFRKSKIKQIQGSQVVVTHVVTRLCKINGTTRNLSTDDVLAVDKKI